MQNSDHINAVWQWFIKDDVSAERKAAYTGRQLVSAAAHHWLCRPEYQLVIQPVHPTISLDHAVFSDVVSDFEDVGLRLGTA